MFKCMQTKFAKHSGEMDNSVIGAHSTLCACRLVQWMCVLLCVLYIFVHAGLREMVCKLKVRCRPQCRLMLFRQVIYDLSVAGSEKGDVWLSLQINKYCSVAHITSPLHVCERPDLAPDFYDIFCHIALSFEVALSSSYFYCHLNILFKSWLGDVNLFYE